jgi:hypothetical protein
MTENMQNQRFIPVNEIDAGMRTLETSYGKEATSELYNALKGLTSFVVVINQEGKVITNEDGENLIFLINNKNQLVNKDGKVITNDKEQPVEVDAKESSWGLLSYYSKDLRLGYLNDNITKGSNEVEIANFYLNIAGDCLRLNYPKSFETALRRVITLIELSQSRNGNLRRDMITIKQDISQSINKPKKKGILGGKD